MCTLGVWQLEKLLVRYCKSSGSSAGVRALLRNDLVEFAARNPQLSCEARHEAGNRPPRVIGRYRACGVVGVWEGRGGGRGGWRL